MIDLSSPVISADGHAPHRSALAAGPAATVVSVRGGRWARAARSYPDTTRLPADVALALAAIPAG